MIQIAVLLTCFNRLEKTKKCIISIAEQNPEYDLTFIITDDCSTDGTIEMLQSLPYKIKLLSGTGSLFWNGGMVKTIEYVLQGNVAFDYVMLVNDDVVFYPNFINHLYHRLMENEGEIIVGSTADHQGNMSYGGVQKTSNHFAKYELQPPTEEITYCDTFNCNCIFMSKEVFEKAGNLDPNYIHSMGDYDYGLGMKKKKLRIINSGIHVGECDDNDTRGSWRDSSLPRRERLKKKEGPKGLPKHDWFYFIKKNYGFLPAIYHSITPYIRILIGK